MGQETPEGLADDLANLYLRTYDQNINIPRTPPSLEPSWDHAHQAQTPGQRIPIAAIPTTPNTPSTGTPNAGSYHDYQQRFGWGGEAIPDNQHSRIPCTSLTQLHIHRSTAQSFIQECHRDVMIGVQLCLVLRVYFASSRNIVVTGNDSAAANGLREYGRDVEWSWIDVLVLFIVCVMLIIFFTVWVCTNILNCPHTSALSGGVGWQGAVLTHVLSVVSQILAPCFHFSALSHMYELRAHLLEHPAVDAAADVKLASDGAWPLIQQHGSSDMPCKTFVRKIQAALPLHEFKLVAELVTVRPFCSTTRHGSENAETPLRVR